METCLALSAGQAPAVGSDALPSSEAETNVVRYSYRHVERAVRVGHVTFSAGTEP